jgi:hypothetical protein
MLKLSLGGFGVLDALLCAGPLLVVPRGLRALGERPIVRWVLSVSGVFAAAAVVLRAVTDTRSSAAVALSAVWLVACGWFAATRRADAVALGAALWGARRRRADSERGSAPIVDLSLRVSAAAFLVVGASWLSLATLRIPVLGFPETLVLLTAVHFHMAGFGLCALARLRVSDAAIGSLRERRLLTAGSVTVVAATGLVAVGHLTVGVLEFVGALTMACGVGLLALGTSLQAERADTALSRRLLIVSALAPAMPMVLAVHYGLNQVVSVQPLAYTTIAFFHGAVNVFGMLLPGLSARVHHA